MHGAGAGGRDRPKCDCCRVEMEAGPDACHQRFAVLWLVSTCMCAGWCLLTKDVMAVAGAMAGGSGDGGRMEQSRARSNLWPTTVGEATGARCRTSGGPV